MKKKYFKSLPFLAMLSCIFLTIPLLASCGGTGGGGGNGGQTNPPGGDGNHDQLTGNQFRINISSSYVPVNLSKEKGESPELVHVTLENDGSFKSITKIVFNGEELPILYEFDVMPKVGENYLLVEVDFYETYFYVTQEVVGDGTITIDKEYGRHLDNGTDTSMQSTFTVTVTDGELLELTINDQSMDVSQTSFTVLTRPGENTVYAKFTETDFSSNLYNVHFEYDKEAIDLTYDKLAGETSDSELVNFSFTLNEGYELNNVIINEEITTLNNENKYSFTPKNGENFVIIETTKVGETVTETFTIDQVVSNNSKVEMSKTSRVVGEKVFIRVTPDLNYEIKEVYFNDETIKCDTSVYSFVVTPKEGSNKLEVVTQKLGQLAFDTFKDGEEISLLKLKESGAIDLSYFETALKNANSNFSKESNLLNSFNFDLACKVLNTFDISLEIFDKFVDILKYSSFAKFLLESTMFLDDFTEEEWHKTLVYFVNLKDNFNEQEARAFMISTLILFEPNIVRKNNFTGLFGTKNKSEYENMVNYFSSYNDEEVVSYLNEVNNISSFIDDEIEEKAKTYENAHFNFYYLLIQIIEANMKKISMDELTNYYLVDSFDYLTRSFETINSYSSCLYCFILLIRNAFPSYESFVNLVNNASLLNGYTEYFSYLINGDRNSYLNASSDTLVKILNLSKEDTLNSYYTLKLLFEVTYDETVNTMKLFNPDKNMLNNDVTNSYIYFVNSLDAFISQYYEDGKNALKEAFLNNKKLINSFFSALFRKTNFTSDASCEFYYEDFDYFDGIDLNEFYENALAAYEIINTDNFINTPYSQYGIDLANTIVENKSKNVPIKGEVSTNNRINSSFLSNFTELPENVEMPSIDFMNVNQNYYEIVLDEYSSINFFMTFEHFTNSYIYLDGHNNAVSLSKERIILLPLNYELTSNNYFSDQSVKYDLNLDNLTLHVDSVGEHIGAYKFDGNNEYYFFTYYVY